MENFEINILIDSVKELRIIRERINNVNDDEYDSLTNAIKKIDEAIEFIEVGSPIDGESDLEYLSEWIDLKTEKSDETATLIIEKITEMLKQKHIPRVCIVFQKKAAI